MTDTRAQMAAGMFMPVLDGYVFREPYRWPFTQARHYLVNEAQRDKIIAMIVPKRPMLWQIALWGTLCLMVVAAGFVVWAFTRHENPTLVDTISMMVLTFAQVVVAFLFLRWLKLRELRPLLASLPTTDLKITRSDMQRQSMNAMSIRQLILLGAINVMACSSFLISGIIFLILSQSQGLFYLAGALLFGALTFLYYRLLIDRVENTPAKAATSP
ncbi:hypothetical protein LJR220_003611 [Bradyrhizobium sp. LjRoot220]|uniref:hypothetical protein n=1 Tax=Bradyrhizobium sp. LjRoot220 TaxID=3342284 RepID=UPI003ECCBA4B